MACTPNDGKHMYKYDAWKSSVSLYLTWSCTYLSCRYASHRADGTPITLAKTEILASWTICLDCVSKDKWPIFGCSLT